MEKLISPNQGTLIEGRWITENAIIVQELVYKMRRYNGREGLMIMKSDLKKAYDRLEWSFLDVVLKAWGFSNYFCKLAFNCI